MYDLTPGTPYRHFKGNVYIIHCISVDADTGADLVTYVDKDGKFWTRNMRDFCGYVEIPTPADAVTEDGSPLPKTVLIPRFTQITDEELLEAWREK